MSKLCWQRYNQEEDEGPFSHNGNICTLNRILGFLLRDFFTCPSNLFSKRFHHQAPRERVYVKRDC